MLRNLVSLLAMPEPTLPEDPLSREELLRRINLAEISGLTYFAAALRELYDRRFGFRTVTGADFRRSMDWAATAPRLRDHIGHIAAASQPAAPQGGCP